MLGSSEQMSRCDIKNIRSECTLLDTLRVYSVGRIVAENARERISLEHGAQWFVPFQILSLEDSGQGIMVRKKLKKKEQKRKKTQVQL